MARVVITHARVRSALVATQSLGKHDIEVTTADSIYPSTSFFSRYSSSHFIYPSFKLHPSLFINSLKAYMQKKDVGVLMPISEEVFLISKYKNIFSDHVNIPICDYETIKKANNNSYLIPFADELGVKVPQTHTITDIGDLDKVSEMVDFPAVIKLAEGVGSAGLRYVCTEEELISEYKRTVQQFNLDSCEYPLIQEYIPGDGYGVAMLFNEGDPRAMCAYKNIRVFPITGGPSTARISIRHSKMEKCATTLLKELNYHGVAEVEFILDNRTNEPVLMEINPRFWGSLNQAICAGVDFPYLLYIMATEGDVKPVFTYKTGVKTRWMLGDCRALVDYVRTDKRREVIKDFCKLYGRNLYYDDLSISDPLPTLVEFIIPLVNFIKTGELRFSPEVGGR